MMKKGFLFMKKKQILAIIAIFLLIGMYVATFILAFCDFPDADRLLKGFMLLDIAAPIFLWILIYLYQKLGKQ